MSHDKTFYLTTTLPYVNAAPHIGFALEIVQADAIARYKRLLLGDKNVFFNFGVDEHGQKIAQKAQENGKTPQEYVDEFAAKFDDLKSRLNLTYSAFIRTTDSHHKSAAQEIWKRCLSNVGPEGPDIYKKSYKGLYCVGDEAFIKESDLVAGKCPNHPTMDPIEIEEENYFFRLSRYEGDILKYLEREDVILPEWRRQEAINFVNQGLEDFSISRVKEKMSWGIPVPGDDSQVMYVWFDALTNYISTLGWPEDVDGNFKKFWQEGETLQLAGKDQVRFQSVIWQAMLMSSDIKTTGQVFYHGFITSGGQKMSKSLGNVIDPLSIVEEYGTDALRYFLLRHIHAFEDSDFTMEKFKEAYNADLANGLGNLVSRVMNLAQIHLREPVAVSDSLVSDSSVNNAMESFDFQLVTSLIQLAVTNLDQEIQLKQPFKVIKTDKDAGIEMIRQMVTQIVHIGKLIEPIMPDTSKKIIDAVRENKKPENLFARKD